PSYRTRHLPPLDLPDSNSDHATKSDRISGKKRTQFPEPTWLGWMKAEGIPVKVVRVKGIV
ncbi:MAG: hypothetical protein ABSA52_19545, partial [Candidatus Binatia bacterium]